MVPVAVFLCKVLHPLKEERVCVIEMGENYNKSKKEEVDVKNCPEEKVEYIKEALRYLGFI